MLFEPTDVERLRLERQRVRDLLRKVGMAPQRYPFAHEDVRVAAAALVAQATSHGDEQAGRQEIPSLPPAAWQHLVMVLTDDATAAGASPGQVADILEALRRSV